MVELNIKQVMERTKLMTDFVDWAYKNDMTRMEFTQKLGELIEEYTHII